MVSGGLGKGLYGDCGAGWRDEGDWQGGMCVCFWFLGDGSEVLSVKEGGWQGRMCVYVCFGFREFKLVVAINNDWRSFVERGEMNYVIAIN